MKKAILLLPILLFSIYCFAQVDSLQHANALANNATKNTGKGLGIGSIIAVILSWRRNHSILWAIFHLFCGWFYVIYYLFTRNKK